MKLFLSFITLSLIALPSFSFEEVVDQDEFDAEIVEFHIAPGTGKNPWNTPDTMVRVKVGQTLRIINEDNMVHMLHTNGKPCPHQPKDSKTGDYYDCFIKTPVTPEKDILYDHNVGSKARFYLEATN